MYTVGQDHLKTSVSSEMHKLYYGQQYLGHLTVHRKSVQGNGEYDPMHPETYSHLLFSDQRPCHSALPNMYSLEYDQI